jgi:hypothetical protein
MSEINAIIAGNCKYGDAFISRQCPFLQPDMLHADHNVGMQETSDLPFDADPCRQVESLLRVHVSV